ncbi:MAG: response regulator [Bacteroidales bacterium]|nr:response regulator [Bacteroidales bacterium]
MKVILVVEDDDISYQFLRIVLQKANIKVLHAEDGEQAIEMCKKNKNIDLVLMDIQLPVIDGLEATKQIRIIRKELPIIAQTANTMNEEKEKCFKAGCNDYIAKPFNKNKLLKIVNKYLI